MSTSICVKRLLDVLIRPLALLVVALGGRWTRFWCFAKFNAQLGSLDSSIVVLGTPELHGTKRIELGRDLYLYRDLYLETREQGSIRIGDGVVISRGVHLVAFDRIDIGQGSMIGEYASLRDANHQYGTSSLRESGYHAKPICIGRQVWIGRGVTILPGVSIGDFAVVGANAVVTRDVAAYTIVAGVPAQPISKRD